MKMAARTGDPPDEWLVEKKVDEMVDEMVGKLVDEKVSGLEQKKVEKKAVLDSTREQWRDYRTVEKLVEWKDERKADDWAGRMVEMSVVEKDDNLAVVKVDSMVDEKDNLMELQLDMNSENMKVVRMADLMVERDLKMVEK